MTTKRPRQTLLIAAVLATICTDTIAGSITTGVVNINTASVAQLSLLPHVGAKAAQRIVDYRKTHGAFVQPTDLMQVKGISARLFERIDPYIVLDGSTTLRSKIRVRSANSWTLPK